MNKYTFIKEPTRLQKFKLGWQLSKLFGTLEVLQQHELQKINEWSVPEEHAIDMEVLEVLEWLFYLYNSCLPDYKLLTYCTDYLSDVVSREGNVMFQPLLTRFLTMAEDCQVLTWN